MARMTLSQKRAALREKLRKEKADYRLLKMDFKEVSKAFNAISRDALRAEKRIAKLQDELADLA